MRSATPVKYGTCCTRFELEGLRQDNCTTSRLFPPVEHSKGHWHGIWVSPAAPAAAFFSASLVFPLDAAGVHMLRRSPTSLCEALTREEFKCLEMEDNKTISCIVVATFTPSLSSYQSSSRYFWSPSFLAQRLRLGRSDFYDALLLTRVVTGFFGGRGDGDVFEASHPLYWILGSLLDEFWHADSYINGNVSSSNNLFRNRRHVVWEL